MNFKISVFKLLARGCWMVGWMVGILLIFSRFVCPVIWWNFSPSAPEGIYIYAPSQKLHYGDFVIVLLPIDVAALHVKQGHRMLKRVQGFPGDSYTVTNDSLLLRNRDYPIANKMRLPHIPPGDYVVNKANLLFLNAPDISFDSRYLGQFPEKNVICKVLFLISFQKITDFVNGVKQYANW